MDREVVELYLDDIIPNRFQPREVFNEEALRELSNSIREHGVIQPIIVRKLGDKYEIIAGERRYKASAMAGLTKIPAIIRNLDDKEASKVALLENLQRKDLTAIEEARTYQKILELDSMTQEELGRTMGKSQAAIANKMRLLSLPDEIQEALLQDKISERHARSLLNLDSSEEQIAMLHNIINKRMTVRELDNEIKKIKGEPYGTTDIQIENKISEPPLIENIKQVEYPTTDSESNNFIFDLNPENPAPEQKEVKELNINSTPQPLPSVLEDILLKPKSARAAYEDKEQPSEIKNETQETLPEKNKYSIEELLDDEELYSLKNAIAEINKSIEIVKSKGFLVKMEEMDFESTYQIIIQIDKNN